MRRTLPVMGVKLTDQTVDEALDELGIALRSPGPKTVFFPNASTLNLACDDAGYRAVLNGADFVYGDGTGIRWAARARGIRLQANLNGTDMIPALIKRHEGLRVFLLGGDQDFINTVADRFAGIFPTAQLAGYHHGFFDHEDCDDVIARINEAKPDLLLVGMGNPLQERWLVRHRNALSVPLSAGVGGLFAYWAGTLQRAPEAFRASGFEWLHILLRQPRKARRYLLGNPLFIMRILTWLPSDRRAAVEPASFSQTGNPIHE